MIIGVALRFPVTGMVMFLPKPYRHHHLFRALARLDPDPGAHSTAEQGFLSSEGLFLNRTEAKECAMDNDQVLPSKRAVVYTGPELFSEDLW